MLVGISLQSHPTGKQKLGLSKWMGCSNFIWNAKTDEEKYQFQFAKKYLPIGTYPEVDQTYAQYKDKELSPWLFDCPSQILRNSAVRWHSTYQKFLKGECGKPKRKRKSDTSSILLTRELFKLEKCKDGVTRLFIGTKTNNLGYLSLKNHTSYEEPNAIWIKRKNGKYTVSFCYEDGIEGSNLPTLEEHLEYLKTCSESELQKCTIGIDRGVVRPVQAGDLVFEYNEKELAKKRGKERYVRRCQRRLAKQTKGSKRRERTKRKLAKASEKISNKRKDFCHKTSRAIVDLKEIKVIIFEDLKTSQMTKKVKPKKDERTNTYKPNGRRAKAGLNKAILDIGWHQLERFVYYKAHRAGKAVFKVSAHYTSQECSSCSYTHPDNRKTQAVFNCRCCGYTDNADRNSAVVLTKRAIKLFLDSGTELSERGVLLDKGRGAADKTQKGTPSCASSKEASKKKAKALVA